MVAAGCGSYGDGPQQQEDSRGFSYLVALHSPPPLNSTTQAAPTAAVLCKMVTAEVTASPKCHCYFLEVLGCTGAVLLPEGEGPECLQGHLSWGGGFMCTPNPAGGSVGSFSKKPSRWLPGVVFVFSSKATSVCRQMQDGGLMRGVKWF